ncbi:MAG TPA: electron transport complex subunit RsxA [Clostridiaceae bacterium]|nr:electron transport complex subunit RsxA [Clostridiaceae bacterium]
MDLMIIFINAMLVNNFVLSRFLGICGFLGVSKKRDASIGMGLAVLFVMSIASIGTWSVYTFLLEPNGLDYLKTVAFILVIAALVQFVEMVVKKMSPALYDALGIFLPLITTNCAVLGVTFLNVQDKLSLGGSLVNALGAALGFFLAIVLMASIREKLDRVSSVPRAFQGLPIALITAGLMAISFLGFKGLI